MFFVQAGRAEFSPPATTQMLGGYGTQPGEAEARSLEQAGLED